MKKSKLFLSALTLFLTFHCSAQYTMLLHFNGTTNGGTPLGSPISDGNFLYGMTQYGGTNDMGIIFRIKKDGTGDTVLLIFNGTNGSYPTGDLVSVGPFLYGMTQQGGTHKNRGTIFKIKPDGNGYVKLLDFDSINGSAPMGSLISDGTFLFGMTYQGGTSNMGTVFKIKPDGTGDTVLFNFAGSAGANGSYPHGNLVSDGTFLYGMTTNGGTSDLGVIFKIKPDGTGDTVLLNFAGASNGKHPLSASLISDGTFLYGMTSEGGTGTCTLNSTINGCGTIFKIKPDGTYFKLLDFANVPDGGRPEGSLISVGSYLYGMTSEGGTGTCNTGCGTIFKIKPDGTGYSKLLNFNDGTNGQSTYPDGTLISDGTFFYGMTEENGVADGQSVANSGSIFKFNPFCTAVTFSQSSTVCAGQSVIVGVHTYTASGSYTDTLKSVSTCDSIVTTNLTVSTATNCTTGITENNSETDINIFPNPTSGLFQVSIPIAIGIKVQSFKIYNIYAECIYQHISTSADYQIDLSSQPNGIYFLQLKTEQGTANKKIVINH